MLDHEDHTYISDDFIPTHNTTSARIFANMINHGEGSPIELDAASNNSVDDIRELIENAQTQSLDSEYKVFIIDEVHMVTQQGFNAFLKTLEEPPAKSIFIMCTTDPQKLPATILSRVQRYNFQKISTEGIEKRLTYICEQEGIDAPSGAIEYLAKLAEGGMRDSITLLDKCLSYSSELTIDNIIDALGVADYSTMLELNDYIINNTPKGIIDVINNVFNSGVDLKQFVRTYFEFILECNILFITKDDHAVKIPENDIAQILAYNDNEKAILKNLLSTLVSLQNSIKYEHSPKSVIIATLLLFEEDLHDRSI